MPYPRIREAPESSSAAVLQAVAASLADAWYQPLPATASQSRVAGVVARLPSSMVRSAVSRSVRDSGLDPSLSRYVSSEGLARQALSIYDRVDNGIGYPAILIGAPNGGVAYLAGLLQIPYLPSQFLLSFSYHSKPDDIKAYFRHGNTVIEPILRRNPDLHAVNHYDPLHDRFLVEYNNHVRLKLLDIPQAYRNFIRDHLAPDGVLIFADCRSTWEQFKIDDRHYFQVGGLGGFASHDYLDGNGKIDSWLDSQGSSHKGGWMLSDDYPRIIQRESEWGSLAEFREATRQFSVDRGYQFYAINGTHPEDFSALAYTAYLWESRMHDREPNGVLVDCFSFTNPTAALRSDLLPLWLPFNCDDSLEYLARMVSVLPDDLPVLLTLLPNFTLTPDMPSAQAWRQIAAKAGPVTWIGTDPERYPIDLASVFDYLPALQQWVRAHPGDEPRPRLTPENLQEMITYLGRYGSELFTLLLDRAPQQAEPPAPDGAADTFQSQENTSDPVADPQAQSNPEVEPQDTAQPDA